MRANVDSQWTVPCCLDSGDLLTSNVTALSGQREPVVNGEKERRQQRGFSVPQGRPSKRFDGQPRTQLISRTRVAWWKPHTRSTPTFVGKTTSEIYAADVPHPRQANREAA